MDRSAPGPFCPSRSVLFLAAAAALVAGVANGQLPWNQTRTEQISGLIQIDPPAQSTPSFSQTPMQGNRYPLPTSGETVLPAGQAERLEEAWAIALEVDQRLESARWNVSAAQRGYRAAEAQRWPLATVEGSYTVRDNQQSFIFSDSSPFGPLVFPFTQREYFGFQGRVSMPLYTSGRIANSMDAALAGVSAAELDVDSVLLDLKLSVAEEYVAVLRAQRELEVAQSQVRSLEAHARDVKVLFDNGRAPQNDLLAAQVALSDGQYQEIRANNVLDVSRAAYNRRLGRPLTAAVQLAPLSVPQETFELDELTAQALGNRPEILRASAEASALRFQADSIRAENRAQVELQGAYTFQENQFQLPEGLTSAGVGVSWNLFDAGRTRNRAAALDQRAEAVLRMRADMQSMITLEVRRAWLDVTETRRRIEVTRDAIDRAEENLRVTRRRYNSGAATNTDVLNAEFLRTRTYLNYHHATYDAVMAVLRLRRATGELSRA